MADSDALPRAFIAAPSGANLSILRNLLESNGVSASDRFDASSGQFDASDDSVAVDNPIFAAIRRASFAVIVYTTGDPNVLFEAGASAALKKPLFVVAPPDESVPPALTAETIVRSTAESATTEHALERFIRSVLKEPRTPASVNPVSKSKVGDVDWARFVGRGEELRATRRFEEFERLVVEFLSLTGAQVAATQGSSPDAGVDAVAWHSGIGHTIGNPLLIEAKMGNLHPAVFDNADGQISKALSRTGGHLALILYLDSSGRRFPEGGRLGPSVIRRDFVDFVRDVEAKSLEGALLASRNRIAHS